MLDTRRFAADGGRVGVPLDAEAGPGRVAHRRRPVTGDDVVCLRRKGPGLGNRAQDGPGGQLAAGDVDGGPGMRGAVQGGVERLVDGVMGGDDAHRAGVLALDQPGVLPIGGWWCWATLGRMSGSSFGANVE